MARRVLWVLAALSVVFAGCTSRDAGDDGTGGEDGGGTGDDDAFGPFFGFVPGAQGVPLPPGTTGLASGVVYDVTTGRPVADAVLRATCADPLGLALTEIEVPLSEHGAFTLSGVGILAACHELRYQAEATGFDMAAPIGTGGLVAGLHHVVYVGLVPV